MSIARKIHNFLHPAIGQVVMLHRIVESIGSQSEASRLELTVDFFAKTLDDLCTRGVDFIGIDSVAQRIKTKHGHSFVCLTFDDGYLDTYTHAYPMLKERQIPFCVYLTRDFYRGISKPQWNPDVEMMEVEQVFALASNPLCTIGVHTCTHPRLSTLDMNAQRQEIAGCKADLEDLLGREISHMAYPHGDYNQDTVKLVAELGFVTAVTTSGRHVRGDSKLLELDRIITN